MLEGNASMFQDINLTTIILFLKVNLKFFMVLLLPLMMTQSYIEKKIDLANSRNQNPLKVNGNLLWYYQRRLMGMSERGLNPEQW